MSSSLATTRGILARKRGLKRRLQRHAFRQVLHTASGLYRDAIGFAARPYAGESEVADAVEPWLNRLEADLLAATRTAWTEQRSLTLLIFEANTGRRSPLNLALPFAVFYPMAAGILSTLASLPLVQTIINTVAAGYGAGNTARQIQTTLAGNIAAIGIAPQAPHLLETWTETLTQLAGGAASYSVGMDPVLGAALWGWQYATVGDDRVRDEHVGFDGVKLPKGDAFWLTNWPPNDWNCRCETIEIFTAPSAGPVSPFPLTLPSGKLVPPASNPLFALPPVLIPAYAP